MNTRIHELSGQDLGQGDRVILNKGIIRKAKGGSYIRILSVPGTHYLQQGDKTTW